MFGRRAFAVWGPMSWNSLPDNLRDSSLFSSNFRRSLKIVPFARYSRTQRNAPEMLHDVLLYKFDVDIEIVIDIASAC